VRAVDTRGGRAANPAKSLHKSRHDVPSISVRSILNLAGCVCEHSGSLVREKRYLSAYQLRCPVPRGPQHSAAAATHEDPDKIKNVKCRAGAGHGPAPATGLTPDTYCNSVRLITTVSRHRIYHRSDPRHSVQPQDPARDSVAHWHALASRLAARPFGLRARAARPLYYHVPTYYRRYFVNSQ
jgi:hypothetical protein